MRTKLIETGFEGLMILEIDFFSDSRGFFIETWNRRDFQAAGIEDDFVQDSHSRSAKKTLRGLHFQTMEAPLAKLVRCSRGAVFDVVIDLRVGSKTFGKWFGLELNDAEKKQLYVPVGFAHGFEVLSDFADVEYKQTGYWNKSHEVTIAWDDPDIGIKWPFSDPILSAKDAKGISFSDYRKKPAFK